LQIFFLVVCSEKNALTHLFFTAPSGAEYLQQPIFDSDLAPWERHREDVAPTELWILASWRSTKMPHLTALVSQMCEGGFKSVAFLPVGKIGELQKKPEMLMKSSTGFGILQICLV
jgi:hypothetical protein